MKTLLFGFSVSAVVLFALASGEPPGPAPRTEPCEATCGSIPLTEAEWKEKLSPEAFRILRRQGTERAFTGKYWNHREAGTYVCVGCATPLFSSEHKFDSGTGWPSFTRPIVSSAVGTREDRSHGMVRTEVYCAKCKGHLGHVFRDGPPPTRVRYCINSIPLQFVAKE